MLEKERRRKRPVANVKTKHAEDQFVNIVKSHESKQPNMNSNKMAAKFAEELNQPNENSDKIERYLTHKGKIRRVLKKSGSKLVRGQRIRSMDRQLMSEVTLLFLFNPLNPELNPICYLLALLAHHFLHVSRIRVKSLTLRLLSYIYMYGAPILDVSRSHTTTHHSR